MDSVDTYVEKVNGYGGRISVWKISVIHLPVTTIQKDRVSREATLNLQVKKLQSLKQGGNKVMITSGNQYAVPYADFVTDMNLDARAVNIIDEQGSILYHGIAWFSKLLRRCN